MNFAPEHIFKCFVFIWNLRDRFFKELIARLEALTRSFQMSSRTIKNSLQPIALSSPVLYSYSYQVNVGLLSVTSWANYYFFEFRVFRMVLGLQSTWNQNERWHKRLKKFTKISSIMRHFKPTKMTNRSQNCIFWKLRHVCHRLLRFQVDCRPKSIWKTQLYERKNLKKSCFFYLNNIFP